MEPVALARLIGLAALVVAVISIALASPASATGYHSWAPFTSRGGLVAHARVKRTSCRTARAVLRHSNHPGWRCHGLADRPVVCTHSGGKRIRVAYGD